MRYKLFYKTNNLHIQIHIHDIIPLLHILVANWHLQGDTPILKNLVHYDTVFGVTVILCILLLCVVS